MADYLPQQTDEGQTRGKERAIPLKRALMDIIVRHGKVKAVGVKKPVSNRTQSKREEIIFLIFKQLKEMEFPIKRPDQLREWHIQKLVTRWVEEKLSPATIQNRLSIARAFAGWIGKPGMVRKSDQYVSDPKYVTRSANADHDHSWHAQGIDKDAMIAMISAYDPYVGRQLRIMSAFGLRREEAVMFKPHRADQGDYIIVRDGTKGGRERSVPIEHPWQRNTLDEAKTSVLRVNGHIGPPDRDLKQALRRFNYVLERHGVTRNGLGITSHGLRHERLCDMFEETAGIPAPVRTDLSKPDVASTILAADPHQIDLARAKVSSAAGHNRLNITNAYIGSNAQAKRAALNWEIPKEWTEAQEERQWQRLGQLKRNASRTDTEEAEYIALQNTLGVSFQNNPALPSVNETTDTPITSPLPENQA